MKTRDLGVRFASQVDFSDNNGCWVWTGKKNSGGYGICHITYNNKIFYLAHRFSYEYYVGEIKLNLDVCHTCDNPACVRPSHLFLGDHFTNMRDCAAKGRFHRKGELNNRAKLSKEDVVEIRKLHIEGKTDLEISSLYGVTKNMVNKIINRKNWSHIE